MNECAREITWAGGQHVFNLNEKRVRAILSMRGLPGQYGPTPAACLKRFEDGIYSISDVERVLELGLAGGGMPARDIAKIMDEHVRSKPLAPNALVAVAVLTGLFVGANVANPDKR